VHWEKRLKPSLGAALAHLKPIRGTQVGMPAVNVTLEHLLGQDFPRLEKISGTLLILYGVARSQ
jgi:hypothetical protein